MVWHVAFGETWSERPPGLSIPDGHRAGGIGLLDGMGGLDFFDGLDIGDLCSLDSSKAQGLSIQANMGADGSGFVDGLCCCGLIPMKFYT